MALDKLTIIDGGGLSTTSDYRVGVITATKFVGPVEGSITATDATFSGNVSIAGTLTYEDVTNVDSVGIITARNGIKVSTGTATTALVVDGDARVTGILTVGTGSLTLDGPNNLVNVGTALTLGHTQGLQFHTQNLHSAGFEVNQINVSGVSTFSGDVDVNANIYGRNLILDGNNGIKYIDADLANSNSITFRGYIGGSYQNMADFTRGGSCGLNFSGNRKLETSNTGVTVTGTVVATGADINGDLDVDGHTNLDNVSIAGVTTSAGIVQASQFKLLDNAKAVYGNSGDMEIYHNATNSLIQNGTGSLQIITTTGDLFLRGQDNISLNTAGNNERLRIKSNGDISVTGDKAIYFGANEDLMVGHDGTSTRIEDSFGYLGIKSNAIELRSYTDSELYAKFVRNGAAELYHDNDRVFFTETRGVRIGDVTKIYENSTHNTAVIQSTDIHHSIILRGSSNAAGTTITAGNFTTFREYGSFVFRTGAINAQERFIIEAGGTCKFIKGVEGGTDEDIAKFIPDGAVELYHDNSKKLETNSSGIKVAGDIRVGNGSGLSIKDDSASETLATFNNNGAVELYHNNTKKFETTSSGATVTGTLVSDGLSVGNGEHISLGNSNQFKLYHDGSNAALQTTSGNTYLYGGGGNFLIRPVNAEQGLNVIANGAVELFHNDVKVCTTTTEGIRVQGAEGGGGKVEIYADEGDDNADKWHLLANTDGTLLIRNLSDGSWDTNIKLTSTSTELYADDSKKLETSSSGVHVIGSVNATSGTNNQVLLNPSDGAIEISRSGSGAYIDFKNTTSEDYDIRINEEGGAFRVNTHFRLYDDKALEIGNATNGDLRIFHDTSATNNVIEGHTGSLNLRNYNVNSTDIVLSARNNILLQTNLNETAIQCIANGAVELFHDSGTYGTAKLQTTTTGIKVNGTDLALNVVGGYIRSVGGQPTVVAHKSSSTFCHIGVENNSNARAFLAYTNDKDFIIGRRTAYTGDHTGYSGRDISIDKTNHAVDICYNGSTRFATTNTGIAVTGNIDCTSDLILDSTNTDHPRIEMHSNASGLIKYAIINGQGWNPDALLIYDLDNDNTRLTIEPNGLGINRGANSISHGLDVGGTAIIRGETEITGRLTLPTTDAGIRFGPGSATNDNAHIEWKGGDNAGYLRISTDDDSDASGTNEYIEFGDYATQNRGGTFTQHCRISRDQFLIKTGPQSGTSDRFKVEENGIIRIYQDLYLSNELNLTDGGNKNRFIDCSLDDGEALFIRSTQGGDANHENMALFHRHGSVNLYHDANEKFATQAHGLNVYGDIHMGGLSNTGTNQNRQIYWTGFDKEASGDNSDWAHIKHTVNVHGIAGSVLEIKALNDANDGIALNASNGAGQIAFVGKKVNVTGYLQPSAGSGDNGIKWPNDPFGGSGDIATMQYYADGSGENTRLRILVANDGDDDLFLEAPGGVYVQGTLGAQTKNFRIPHVLPGLTTTTDLVHSSVESPQADNIYRGRTKLVAGISTVNIDTTNNMTDGTFVNLNRDVQCFTTNETGWTNVKGSVTGNLLTIIAQDNACTDTISWMVIGERWDLAMYNPDNPSTDENGKIKTEVPNRNYAKGYNEDYISENKLRVGISTISRPSIENKEVE